MGYFANNNSTFSQASISWEGRAIWRGGFADMVPSYNQYSGPSRGKRRKAFFQALTSADKIWRAEAERLASPRLASPRLASPRLASPRLLISAW